MPIDFVKTVVILRVVILVNLSHTWTKIIEFVMCTTTLTIQQVCDSSVVLVPTLIIQYMLVLTVPMLVSYVQVPNV